MKLTLVNILLLKHYVINQCHDELVKDLACGCEERGSNLH